MENYKRSVACCLVMKAWLHLVWLVFRFDRWHATAPICCRPYKLQVVDLVTSLASASVLEVGCGLGEIISRIRADRRFGADIDQRVLRAASALTHSVQFAQAALDDVPALRALTGGQVDVLVMVNWPHTLPFDALSQSVMALRDALQLRFVMVDTIVDGALGYQYRHTAAQLSEWGELVECRLAPDGVRHLNLVRLNPVADQTVSVGAVGLP